MVRIKNKEIVEKVLKTIFVIFLAYLIFELVRKLLGGSLSFENLVIALLIANLGFSFYLRESINKIDAKISGHIGWHKGKDNKKN